MNHDTRPAGEKEFADSFISYMLRRYVKIEADLVDQLFNSSESSRAAVGERSALAGPLRNASGDDRHDTPTGQFCHEQVQEIGFIKYNGGLQINTSLLSAVLHE
jgi:CRP/FNR family cyclic AMP-dependent transcriptional regulator